MTNMNGVLGPMWLDAPKKEESVTSDRDPTAAQLQAELADERECRELIAADLDFAARRAQVLQEKREELEAALAAERARSQGQEEALDHVLVLMDRLRTDDEMGPCLDAIFKHVTSSLSTAPGAVEEPRG